ncbi:S-methyl-5'-thioinosine phosphorylase [Marinimicrobium sp. ABcell2]|uniref:S-methyl-5'-thioinosine phosphorylase n=1 Tax=Marinimicrobium sp. ABcell2 TaxID=3069751 RepID=UPI0027B3FAC7|nr:S-methyl-5'-thioinosine phosphorylase [Marinimicrobium sp. ABcell2]MDQ2075585.1 S-methyl-5'-thioinosine phosphorylase [Marinimicrobium sp. ABcell2]
MQAAGVTCAVIGGSGLEQLPEVEVVSRHSDATPYGETSDDILLVRLAGQNVAFLPRHGRDHRLAPHEINYRANLWALSQLGVKQVLAVNAVGGLAPTLNPGKIAVPDQLIDYTWGRKHTFNLRDNGILQHIDFTHPYSPSLRSHLLQTLEKMGVAHNPMGVYACTQGPRLETAAEVRRLVRDGVDMVGMTGMPEAALARELAMEYASVCLCVNWAAGLEAEPLNLPQIYQTLEAGMETVRDVLVAALRNMPLRYNENG